MKFPQVIDSTLLSTWRSCKRKAYFGNFRSLIPAPGVSIDLVAGAAFAKGLEVARRHYYHLGDPPGLAEERGLMALIQAYGDVDPGPAKEQKSWYRMAGAYAFYLDNFPLGKDPIQPLHGYEGIEFSFAVPLSLLHPDTGDPLLFAGRFDLLGTYQGATWGLDDKTCSQLGPTWADQWSLRGQFIGYTWAARQYGFKLNGMIVRGLACYKNDYAVGQAIEYFPDWIIQEWETQLYLDISEMISAYQVICNEELRTETFPKNFGESCTTYGGCPYRQLCRRENFELWIPNNYTEREWNPLDKGD